MEYSAGVNAAGSKSIPAPVGVWKGQTDHLTPEQKAEEARIVREINKNFEDCTNIQFYVTFKK